MRSYDVVEFGQTLQPVDRSVPNPTGSEILLRVLAAGVCHSDIHIWKGYQDLGGGKRLNYADRGLKLPITMGHETVGEVVAIGPDATGVAVGDIRLVFASPGCGSCRTCVVGNEHLCTKPTAFGMFRPGGYSDHILVPHPRYLFDIMGLSPHEAAPLACAGLTAFSALEKVGRSPDLGPIVIFGAGGLGLACLSLLKASGGTAIVVDIDASKRDAAMAAGASAVIDGSEDDVAEQILAAADGPVAATIDFVGAPATMQTAIASLCKGGRAVIVGLIGGEFTLSIPVIVTRALTIQASLMGSLGEQRRLIDFVAMHKLKLMPTQSRPLSEANAALDDLDQGRVIGRVVLKPEGSFEQGRINDQA